jgi:hypothetical protein
MTTPYRTFGTLAILALLIPSARAEMDADLPRQADLMVLGIVLDHPDSAQKAFGVELKPDDPDAMHPSMSLCNHDKHEKLTLEFYERDTATIVSEMHVERIQSPHVDCVVPPQHIEHFVSGKGITLGMSRKEVTDLLGKHYTENAHPEALIISYRIDDKDIALLQRHNAPAYFGQYYFHDNRLIKYEMGFEFPN